MPFGSWPPLAVVVVAFLAAFAWQRGRSDFLAVEVDRAAAAAVASAHGLTEADAMALRVLLGSPDAGRWREVAAAFARERPMVGDALAAVAALGDRATAAQVLAARAVAADPAAAWQLFRGEPAALLGHRFLQLRQRFRDRSPARD